MQIVHLYWLTFNQIPQRLSVLSKLTGGVAVVRVATGCVSSFVPCAAHCFNRSSELKLNNSRMALIIHCFEENFNLYMCFLVV